MARLRRISARQVCLLLECLFTVAVVRCALSSRRSDWLRRRIGTFTVHSMAPNHRLAEIAWAVAAVSRSVPKASCLTQATAGQWILARRGFDSIVRISVPPLADAQGRIAPHAWLMAGDTVVLGGTVDLYQRHRMLHDYPVRAPSVAR
ncbi:lasso peptide biosynthesis B2 protein [Falsirhodobacter sp. 20TX0035]|uniref:lasso peptide biosynthesis B2 protein n=1 Tax=Falsirhodobacter sp. 20TX0035 TaxID=3022019 RepID=UPI00232A8B8B|nr:lasso peptide biosynthesis B2 protein [Falsirhodobacter sp. 20TX0035]MDB6454801.1 lasso peptide biosynthesis B2 protein [Falsirhodobacter sp. 20TX0035]